MIASPQGHLGCRLRSTHHTTALRLLLTICHWKLLAAEVQLRGILRSSKNPPRNPQSVCSATTETQIVHSDSVISKLVTVSSLSTHFFRYHTQNSCITLKIADPNITCQRDKSSASDAAWTGERNDGICFKVKSSVRRGAGSASRLPPRALSLKSSAWHSSPFSTRVTIDSRSPFRRRLLM